MLYVRSKIVGLIEELVVICVSAVRWILTNSPKFAIFQLHSLIPSQLGDLVKIHLVAMSVAKMESVVGQLSTSIVHKMLKLWDFE